MSTRTALVVEYDGSAYFGWQSLADGRGIQDTIEKALAFVANEPVSTVASGRTDSGVHARAQVIHFDSGAVREPRGWILGTNTRLPNDIAVTAAYTMAEDFHARASAVARRYRYTLLNRLSRPALDFRQVAWDARPMDAEAMHQAAQALVGTHDFTSFRALSCQSLSPVRRMDEASVVRDGELIHFEFEANAYLHHQIRNLVGTLMLIGRGAEPASFMAHVLAARDRRAAGPTAAAQGLCFLGPKFPPRFGFPPAMCSDKLRIVLPPR